MNLSPGKNAPELVNVFIEIPMNSNIKYELDKESGVLKVDRILYTSMNYPFNYGFVPGTLAEDGDPIDVLVISRQPFQAGTVIEVRPIGVLYMEDEEGKDEKIIGVPKDKVDPSFSSLKDIRDLSEAEKNKIKHFFEHYKELEPNKWVKVTGWGSAEEAKKMIKASLDRKK